MWLGLRLGGGVFHDASAEARAGAAVALAARFALRAPWFLATRADWSRRGGAAIDTLGASAGAGLTVLDRRAVAIAALAQLRGDLRVTGDHPTARAFGASAVVGVELAVPSTPITVGVRAEHGLTPIVPGARDRAALLELGVDWR